MSKQKLIGLIIGAVVMALGAGFWFIQAQEKPSGFTGPKETLTLGLAPELNYLALLALEKGYFSDEGLEVTVKDYKTGSSVLEDGLLTEEIEVGIIGLGPLVFKSFERDDLRILASVSTLFDLYKIVARKDHGILTPADLQGKRLATSKASTFHYFSYSFLIENGLTEEDVEFYFEKADELPAVLASGEVDAISVREPFISEAQSLLGDNAVVLAAPDLPANTLNLVVLDSFVQNKPQVAEKILRALIRAEDFARDQRDEAIKIIANKLAIEEATVAADWSKAMWQVSLDQELVLGLENIARWAIRNELTEAQTVPNYLNYIYLGGMQTVKPGAMTLIK